MSHCSNHAAMSYLSMVAAVWYLRNHMRMTIILTIITPGVIPLFCARGSSDWAANGGFPRVLLVELMPDGFFVGRLRIILEPFPLIYGPIVSKSFIYIYNIIIIPIIPIIPAVFSLAPPREFRPSLDCDLGFVARVLNFRWDGMISLERL